MNHILVAAFDTLADAQAAKAELLVQQVLDSKIQLSAAAEQAAATAVSGADHTREQSAHDESLGEKISHFFSSLFGNDEHDQPHRHGAAYPEAHRRGATLLTVTAASDEQADLVEGILERHGAIDIDERSASWNAEGADVSPLTHLAGTHLDIDRSQAVDRNLNAAASHAPLPTSGEDVLVGKPEANSERARVVSRVPVRPLESPADAEVPADPSSTLHQETFTQPPAEPLKDR